MCIPTEIGSKVLGTKKYYLKSSAITFDVKFVDLYQFWVNLNGYFGKKRQKQQKYVCFLKRYKDHMIKIHTIGINSTLLVCQCQLLKVHICCISYSLEFKYNLSIMRYFEYHTFSYENVIFYIRLPTVIKIPDDNDRNR